MNSRRIMRTIWLNKGISRIEIAKMLSLDKSTVTMIVSKLIKAGLVETLSEGKAGPQGGRKPIGLGINKSFGIAFGFEMTSEYCEITGVNFDGEIVFSKKIEVDVSGENIVKVFTDYIPVITKEMKKSGLPVLGIGVCVPGIVNPTEGVILQSKLLNIPDKLDFSAEVRKKTNIPVFIENDANCCCWGELAFHKSPNMQDFIFILGEFKHRIENGSDYKGVGIGIGLVVNGKVYYGSDFTAGEFQSILWKPGNMGQFSFSDAEMRKSEKDKTVFLKVVKELALNISLITSTLNLKQIFLGGFFNEMYCDETMEIFKTEIENNWSYMNQTECSINFSSLGNQAAAYGAAGMFLERFFSIPEISPDGVQEDFSGLDLFDA